MNPPNDAAVPVAPLFWKRLSGYALVSDKGQVYLTREGRRELAPRMRKQGIVLPERISAVDFSLLYELLVYRESLD